MTYCEYIDVLRKAGAMVKRDRDNKTAWRYLNLALKIRDKFNMNYFEIFDAVGVNYLHFDDIHILPLDIKIYEMIRRQEA